MDLRKFSPAELATLISKARKRQDELVSRRIPRVRAKIEAILHAEGLSLADVFSLKAGTAPAPAKPAARKSTGTTGRKVEPKYRNPADPTQTWAGRGGQPRWYREALAAGNTEQDLLIKR